MASDRDETRPYGFHSYADDAPWDELDRAEPKTLAAGWSDRPAWQTTGAPPEPPSRRLPLMVGAIAASLIGAGVGWAILREPAAPAAEARVVDSAAPALAVVVTPPPTAPLPTTSERLDVLPSAVAAQTGAPPPRLASEPARPTPPRVLAEATAPPAPVAFEAPSASQAAQNASVPAPPRTTRFDACAEAPTLAYEMVCSDRRLAEADRRMKRAYAAALAAGAPPEDLRRDQDDWLEVREEAARVSHRAVADIYRQRTRELFAIADRGWE